jgi:hypothetical protein
MSTERLYPIAPALAGPGRWDPASLYYPGVTPAGEQVVIFGRGGLLHAFRFDAAGRYLGRLDRPMTVPPSPYPAARPSPTWRADVLAWARELGMSPAPVRVRQFLSEYGGPRLYLEDHPMHFEDGDLGDDEEREETLRRWHERGAFVLCWDGKELWLDGQGRRFQ